MLAAVSSAKWTTFYTDPYLPTSGLADLNDDEITSAGKLRVDGEPPPPSSNVRLEPEFSIIFKF